MCEVLKNLMLFVSYARVYESRSTCMCLKALAEAKLLRRYEALISSVSAISHQPSATKLTPHLHHFNPAIVRRWDRRGMMAYRVTSHIVVDQHCVCGGAGGEFWTLMERRKQVLEAVDSEEGRGEGQQSGRKITESGCEY